MFNAIVQFMTSQTGQSEANGKLWLNCVLAICLCLVMTCAGIPIVVLNYFFYSRTVSFERGAWTFEAKYEVGMGIGTEYSRLSYRGREFGSSLPNQIHTYVVTPVGEFGSYDAEDREWSAVRSNPEVWSRQYRLPEFKSGQPWVRQLSHSVDKKSLAVQGFYQAPPDPHDEPWRDKQLAGTPTHWVYLFLWTNEDAVSKTIGYWVDPGRINELNWDLD